MPAVSSTIDAFESHFGIKNVIVPCYGLAEATLAVAIWPRGVPLRYDASGRCLSVGQPCRGVELRIAEPMREGDAVDLADLPPDTEGEICVKSPGVMQRYYNNPVATATVLTDPLLGTTNLARSEGGVDLAARPSVFVLRLRLREVLTAADAGELAGLTQEEAAERVLAWARERDLLDRYLAAEERGESRAPALPARRGRKLQIEWSGFAVHIDDKPWPTRRRRSHKGTIEISLYGDGVEFLVPA